MKRSAVRQLNWLLAAGVVLPLALFLIASIEASGRLYRDAERDALRVVGVLHEHASKVLETEALVIDQIADRMSSMDWAEVARSNELRQLLAVTDARLPQIESIRILGPDGKVLANSQPEGSVLIPPPAPLLEELLQGGNDETLRTVPPIPTIAGRPGSHGMLRRVTLKDGAGAILVTISADYYSRFYAGILPPGASAGLYRQDGLVLVRWPVVEGQRGAAPTAANSSFRRATEDTPRGTYRATSVLDGVARTAAFSRLDPYGLYVVHGVADSQVQRRWLREVLGYAALAILSSIALTSIAWVGRRRSIADFQYRQRLAGLAAELEERVAERTHTLAESLAEKELLVREVHHRVKNNMQTIMSLLAIQSAAVGPALQEQFRDAARRIETMAELHRLLYEQEQLGGVDFGIYLKRLLENLVRLYGAADRIRTEVQADPVRFDLDLGTPLALISNEVLSNALKHAFPDGRAGMLSVRLAVEGNRVCLTMEDDGIGLPADIDRRREGGLGMKLVRTFARSLRADARIEARPEGGTRISLSFVAPEESLRPVPVAGGAP